MDEGGSAIFFVMPARVVADRLLPASAEIRERPAVLWARSPVGIQPCSMPTWTRKSGRSRSEAHAVRHDAEQAARPLSHPTHRHCT